MKKIILLAFLMVMNIAGYAQIVDNFEVGPYEVDYRGEGDVKSRLRKNVDLYEYFGLKRDTTIVYAGLKPNPVKGAVELDLFVTLPNWALKGCSNMVGISGSWKQQIAKVVYFNAGLSLGASYGKYLYDVDSRSCLRKDWMMEIGLTLSVEFTKLDYNKASVYAGVGFTPTYYSILDTSKTNSKKEEVATAKDSGFLVAPRIDFGGYIPMGNHILRIGMYIDYRINCSGDINIYAKRVGKTFFGANVGIVF